MAPRSLGDGWLGRETFVGSFLVSKASQDGWSRQTVSLCCSTHETLPQTFRIHSSCLLSLGILLRHTSQWFRNAFISFQDNPQNDLYFKCFSLSCALAANYFLSLHNSPSLFYLASFFLLPHSGNAEGSADTRQPDKLSDFKFMLKSGKWRLEALFPLIRLKEQNWNKSMLINPPPKRIWEGIIFNRI